jgi:hypothetical protein
MFDEFMEPEQLVGPEQVVVGFEQAAAIRETDELLKLCGKCEGAMHA